MKRKSKPTFQSFSYPLRAAKNVERKMLSEACQKLSFFEPIENYRYIGFGSTTFTDFILFHKQLGIKNMVSIEHHEDYKARFEFNKPYKCIDLVFGNSNAILRKFDWKSKTIVWLDYESGLNQEVLNDIALISMKAVSGTTLIVTLNANPKTFKLPESLKNASKAEQLEYPLKRFAKNVGENKIPIDMKGKDLGGNSLPTAYRKVAMAEIEKVLADRNGMLPEGKRIEYMPLFNFLYRDGTQMMTIGGVFHEKSDKHIIEKCNFESLPYVKTGEEAYKIEMPILTSRERRYLDSMLPAELPEDLDIGLTEDEISNYQKLYRYFPSFVEVEIT